MRKFASTVALGAAVLLVACENPTKAPADAAIQAAEKAMAAVKEEVAQYAPEQLKGMTEALEAAKAKFKSGEFAGALAAAKELPGKVSAAVSAAKARKEQLTLSFEEALRVIPRALEKGEARIAELSKLKKLPKEVSAEALARARTTREELAAGWTKAQEAFKSGALADAVELLKGLPEKAAALLEQLGLTT